MLNLTKFEFEMSDKMTKDMIKITNKRTLKHKAQIIKKYHYKANIQ